MCILTKYKHYSRICNKKRRSVHLRPNIFSILWIVFLVNSSFVHYHIFLHFIKTLIIYFVQISELLFLKDMVIYRYREVIPMIS